MAMVKTTVYLPDSMKRGLERIAIERGVTEAVVIREALAVSLRGTRPKPRYGFIEGDPGEPIDWNTNDHLEGFGER